MKNNDTRFAKRVDAVSPEEIASLDEKLHQVRGNLARLQRLLHRLSKERRNKFLVVLLQEFSTLGHNFTACVATEMVEGDLKAALHSGNPEAIRQVKDRAVAIAQERD